MRTAKATPAKIKVEKAMPKRVVKKLHNFFTSNELPMAHESMNGHSFFIDNLTGALIH